MRIIEADLFTDIPRSIRIWLFGMMAIASIATILAFSGVERSPEPWVDPGKAVPAIDTPVLCLYLIDGEVTPVIAKMTYIFDAILNKTEFWHIDSEHAQQDLGRPYRWAILPSVPDRLLWATKRSGR